jgi:2-dehydropantoate 2-reductase
MRIALVGAGAMGTIIGSLLTEKGYDVELVDSYREHVEAMKKNGAKIIGGLEKIIPVKAIMPEEVSGVYDLIISITKHGGLIESLENIKPCTHEDTIVLTLQNGMPEEKSKLVFPEENLLGGGMEFSGTFIGPGVTKLASDADTLGVSFGSYLGPVTDKVMEVKEVLGKIGHVEITENLKGVRWTKLSDNSTFSGFQTALGCTVGEVLDNDEAMDCIAYIGMECAKVVQAQGVTPVELFGLLPSPERVCFSSLDEKEKVKEYWKEVYSPYRGQIASMLQDIRNGKQCEINNINGETVRIADEVGVEVPFNKKIVEVVTKLQDKETDLSNAWNNLDEFRKLI